MAAVHHGTPYGGLLLIGLVVGAFLLGRRKGRNTATARADAVAVAAADGGDATASGGEAGSTAGVVVQLHIGAGADPALVRDAMHLIGSGVNHDDDSAGRLDAAAVRSIGSASGSGPYVSSDSGPGVVRVPVVAPGWPEAVVVDGRR